MSAGSQGLLWVDVVLETCGLARAFMWNREKLPVISLSCVFGEWSVSWFSLTFLAGYPCAVINLHNSTWWSWTPLSMPGLGVPPTHCCEFL